MNQIDLDEIATNAIQNFWKWHCSSCDGTKIADSGDTGQKFNLNGKIEPISAIVCADCGKVDLFAHSIRDPENKEG